jgi:hypothetical protein
MSKLELHLTKSFRRTFPSVQEAGSNSGPPGEFDSGSYGRGRTEHYS